MAIAKKFLEEDEILFMRVVLEDLLNISCRLT